MPSPTANPAFSILRSFYNICLKNFASFCEGIAGPLSGYLPALSSLVPVKGYLSFLPDSGGSIRHKGPSATETQPKQRKKYHQEGCEEHEVL
jgi:hypothetical protein